MARKVLKSLDELGKALTKDLGTLQGRVLKGVEQTADLGKTAAYGRAPVAFGELREGIEVQGEGRSVKIVSTAPYSAAVEVGSRPHWPPIEPILAWVQLRGTQALDTKASGGAPRGTPDRVSKSIAAQGTDHSTPVDAALVVARAICAGIAAHGTAPTHFMLSTVPDVVKILDAYVKSNLSEPL